MCFLKETRKIQSAFKPNETKIKLTTPWLKKEKTNKHQYTQHNIEQVKTVQHQTHQKLQK